MASKQDLRRLAGRARYLGSHLSKEKDRRAASDYANELDAQADALGIGDAVQTNR